jgi:high-affinity Fe2+/Pb2+ permease
VKILLAILFVIVSAPLFAYGWRFLKRERALGPLSFNSRQILVGVWGLAFGAVVAAIRLVFEWTQAN